MSHVTGCVDKLSQGEFGNLVPGWPRKERYREVRADTEAMTYAQQKFDERSSSL